jgi:hypothetical protein
MLVVAIRKVASKCSSVRRVLVPSCFHPTEQLLTNIGTSNYEGHEQCVFSYSTMFFLRHIFGASQGIDSFRI